MIAAPPIPEPVSGPLPGIFSAPPPLRRFVQPDGWAIEISDRPEPVYLLCRSDEQEVPVPVRLTGHWNPATVSGRHFFLHHEPDAALDLVGVRRATYYIGRLAFPSGWAASPWLAGPSKKVLLRRLRDYAAEFQTERLSRSPALSRTTLRPSRERRIIPPHSPR